jgi:hypothetical protein
MTGRNARTYTSWGKMGLGLVLCLTAPRASPTRLRPLPWGGTPPPSPAGFAYPPGVAGVPSPGGRCSARAVESRLICLSSPVMDEVLPGRQEAPLAMVGRNLFGKSRFELFDPTARPCTSMLGKGSRCWISPSEQGIVALNSQIITVDECAGWCFSTMSSLADLSEPKAVFNS